MRESRAHRNGLSFRDTLTLRWLYVARDADAAGIEAHALSPRLGDFNEDLRTLGIDALRAALRIQLAPQDVVRFMLRAIAVRE
jgi:hypothetical protein